MPRSKNSQPPKKRKAKTYKPVPGINNVVDRRKFEYRFKNLNAVVEATWHDNTCPHADKVPTNGRGGVGYSDYEGCTLAQAVDWANTFDSPVTLYLYDEGGGLCDVRRRQARKRR